MQTIWPNLIVHRELNTLGIRQIVPRGPNMLDMYWVMFGYADDDAERNDLRLCQACCRFHPCWINAGYGDEARPVDRTQNC